MTTDTFMEDYEKRINNTPPMRGIIDLKDKTLKDVYEERKTPYDRYADLTVDCKNKTKK